MRPAILAGAAVLLTAAGPTTSFFSVAPMPDFAPNARRSAGAQPGSPTDYTAAPTPNQDAVPPTPPKASQDASLTPGFFGRHNQAQSDGYLPSSSLQSETDRKARPGAGINLSMPLQ